MKATVILPPDTPSYARAALTRIPELQVENGYEPALILGNTSHRLAILPRPSGGSSNPAPLPPPHTIGIVIARELTSRERQDIEDVGLSWCDARGAIHIDIPGVYVHIDRTGRSTSRASKVEKVGLGVTGIRGVQAILANPADGWSVGRLAKAAAISVGQAHNILTAMDHERLLETHGSGPKQRRYLKDTSETLAWLAGIEHARRRPDSAAAFLYARTFDDLIFRFADRARQANVRYALTAASGAYALGHPVLTNMIVLQVRVGPLDAVQTLDLLGLEHLEADDAGRGMNLELWTDAGELGTFQSEQTLRQGNEVRVAPRARVWLDMMREGGRQADAASLFKEQALV